MDILGEALHFDHDVTWDGFLLTPASIAVTVFAPDGVTTLTPVAAAVGEYGVDFTPETVGWHTLRWRTVDPDVTTDVNFRVVDPAWMSGQPAIPSTDDVQAILPRRTVFTDESVPSLTEVRLVIDQIVGEVDAELLGPVPPEAAVLARDTIALGAAAYIELGFFPEQQEGEGATGQELYRRYSAALARLRDLVHRPVVA